MKIISLGYSAVTKFSEFLQRHFDQLFQYGVPKVRPDFPTAVFQSTSDGRQLGFLSSKLKLMRKNDCNVWKHCKNEVRDELRETTATP